MRAAAVDLAGHLGIHLFESGGCRLDVFKRDVWVGFGTTEEHGSALEIAGLARRVQGADQCTAETRDKTEPAAAAAGGVFQGEAASLRETDETDPLRGNVCSDDLVDHVAEGFEGAGQPGFVLGKRDKEALRVPGAAIGGGCEQRKLGSVEGAGEAEDVFRRGTATMDEDERPTCLRERPSEAKSVSSAVHVEGQTRRRCTVNTEGQGGGAVYAGNEEKYTAAGSWEGDGWPPSRPRRAPAGARAALSAFYKQFPVNQVAARWQLERRAALNLLPTVRRCPQKGPAGKGPHSYPMNLFPPECTVALIDDRPESKDLIGYAIKSSFPSIRVREHASAREFIDGLATERPAAVITRQRLYGDMDGLSLTRVLRSSGFSGPILMITNAEELRAEAEQAGISAFMSFDRWAELPSRLASLLTAGAT